jgi:hypothetical protein
MILNVGVFVFVFVVVAAAEKNQLIGIVFFS